MAINLIIGGSSGLGAQLASHAPKSDKVIIAARKQPEHLEGTFLSLDLTNKENITSAADKLKQMIKNEPVRIFMSAGVGWQGRLTDQTTTSIQNIIDLLVTGPLYFFKSIESILSNDSHIIFIGSTTASKVRSNETVYGAAKAGQAQMARNLYQEFKLKWLEIKFTLVHPGGMATPFWNGTPTDTTKFLKAEEVAKIIWQNIEQQAADHQGWVEYAIERQDGQPVNINGTPSVVFPK